jgi:hypothetical protein
MRHNTRERRSCPESESDISWPQLGNALVEVLLRRWAQEGRPADGSTHHSDRSELVAPQEPVQVAGRFCQLGGAFLVG